MKPKDVDTKLHHRFAVTWECTTFIIGPSGRMRTHSGGEKKRCGFGRKGNTNRRGINATSERAKWKWKRAKCELATATESGGGRKDETESRKDAT